MSRVGKTPISIPVGTTLTKHDSEVKVTGPKGSLTVAIPVGLDMESKTNQVFLVSKTQQDLKNLHGLTRALLANALIGVTKGWSKQVELVGVGYRVTGGEKELIFNIGFTHPIKITAPPNISFAISENNKVVINGLDKQLVGDVAAKIRNFRPPEPYKGKGIRYQGEIVRKKAGKAVKAIGTPA